MPEVEPYFREIDLARARRVKELSELKRVFFSSPENDPLNVRSQAVVVLSYAAWEGFYNECVRTYIKFLKDRGRKIVEEGWLLLVGVLSAEFDSLRARNHSGESKVDFVDKLKSKLECGFEGFDAKTVMARSNLNFEKVSSNYQILGFDMSEIIRHRLRIDKEVVGWRHGVAHGDAPELGRLDVSGHIDFVSNLLLIVADCFEFAILERS